MKQKLFFAIFLILICSAFNQAQTAPQPQNIVPNLTIKQWREDLHFLAQAIAKGHPDAFAKVDEKVFEQAVSNLDKNIPTLKRHEIIVEMARIVALIKDGPVARIFEGYRRGSQLLDLGRAGHRPEETVVRLLRPTASLPGAGLIECGWWLGSPNMPAAETSRAGRRVPGFQTSTEPSRDGPSRTRAWQPKIDQRRQGLRLH